MAEPAHVYAADQGLHLENETVEALLYDDATYLALVIKGNVIFAYDLGPDAPAGHERLVWTYPLQEGPSVVSAKCSLDRGLLALQRSDVLLEMVDLSTGNISVHTSDKGRSEMLGFFFSEWPEAEVVLVMRTGLELCQFAARRQGLRCRDRIKLPIIWHTYTHETRCLLAGTGPAGAPYVQVGGSCRQGCNGVEQKFHMPSEHVSSAVMGTSPFSPIQPPPATAAAAPTSGAFQASSAPGPGPGLPVSTHAGTLPVSTHAGLLNSYASPVPGAAPGRHSSVSPGPRHDASAAAGRAGTQPPGSSLSPAGAVVSLAVPWGPGTLGPVVGPGGDAAAGRVRLLKLYGRVYTAHINTPYKQLELYRFYTDSVVLQHVYPLHSQQVDLLVVDNVLVVVHLDTGMAMLVDVYTDSTTSPLSRALQHLGLLVAVPHQRRLDEEHRQQVQLRNLLKEQQQRLKQQAQTAARQAKGGGRASSAARDRSSEVQVSAPAADHSQQATATQQQPTLQEELAGYLMVVVPGPWPATYAHWRFTLPNLIIDPSKQVVSRLMLDLSAICTALAPTDPAWLVGFLQRRRSQRLLVQHIGYHLPPLAPTAANVQAVLGPGEGAVAAGTVPAPDAVLSTSPDPGFEEAAQGLGPSSPTESGAASRGKGTPEPGADGDAPTSGSLAFLSPVGSPMLMSLLSNMVASPSSNQVGGGGSEPGGMQMGPLVMVAAANPAVLSSKQLLVNVLRGALKARAPLSILRAVFDEVVGGYLEAAALAAGGRAGTVSLAGILSPLEVTNQILLSLIEGGGLLSHDMEYVKAAVVEYSAAAAAHGAALPAPLQLLTLQLMAQLEQQDQVAQQLYSQWRHTPVQLADKLAALVVEGQQQDAAGGAEAALAHAGHNPVGVVARAAVALQVESALLTAGGIADGSAPSIPSQATADSRGAGGVRGSTAGPPSAPGLPTGASTTAGQASNSTSQGSGSAEEVMVRSLLSSGSVLRAARLVRDLHLTCVLPQDLLAAAAKAGQALAFAAIYRAFRESLMPVYPSFEAAQAAYGLAAGASPAPVSVV